MFDFLKSKPKKKWHIIERPNESREYLQGWSIAGKALQVLFNKENNRLTNPYQGFCWLRTQIISPTFDSMNFRYKNMVFSVLVDLVSEGDKAFFSNLRPYDSLMSNELKMHQLDECKKNDIIPCLFRIEMDNMHPLEDGWNLINTETGKTVVPTEVVGEELHAVSEWELLNWGISIVVSELKKRGNKILSFTDMPGIMPQLWFEDKAGNKCWVQVVVNKPMEMFADYNVMPEGFKGYMAGVRIRPTEGNNILYRSQPADVEFLGISALDK